MENRELRHIDVTGGHVPLTQIVSLLLRCICHMHPNGGGGETGDKDAKELISALITRVI